VDRVGAAQQSSDHFIGNKKRRLDYLSTTHKSRKTIDFESKTRSMSRDFLLVKSILKCIKLDHRLDHFEINQGLVGYERRKSA